MPKFCFGPRAAIGSSQFVTVSGSPHQGIGLQLGLSARWQLSRFFGVEFSPGTSVYGGQISMITKDVDARGTARLFPYRDIYHVYSVEFPAYTAWSIGDRKVMMRLFTGSGVGLTMAGTHSLRYEDAQYNAAHGYSGHAMRELESSYVFATIGLGLDFKMPKGVLSIDARMQRTNRIAAIAGSPFAARSAVIGASWKVQ